VFPPFWFVVWFQFGDILSPRREVIDMSDENKRMIQKTDDERLHDLALLYMDMGSSESPAEFFKRYADIKEQLRSAKREHIQSFKQDRPQRSPV